MSKIFMNSENSKTSHVHRLMLDLKNKLDLQRGDNRVTLSNLSIYCTWKNIKKWYRNNEFKIPGIVWDNEFELTDGSYPISDIED